MSSHRQTPWFSYDMTSSIYGTNLLLSHGSLIKIKNSKTLKANKILCFRFSLNPSEVGSKMEGVPIQDTMLSAMCPDIESAFCFPHKYRTINGECNNVKNPTWGITGAAYLRILQPMYQDGEYNTQKNLSAYRPQ